jgi:hypothetical protein
MVRFTRFLAAASLIALLAACGGEGGKDREDGPVDREKPSLGAPQDGDDDGGDRKEENDGKDSRGEGEDDAND